MRPSKAMLLPFSILICLPAGLAAQTEPTALQSGSAVERTITRGQTQSFIVSLEQDQLLHFVVDQRGIDVVVVVSSPAGKRLGRFDTPNGPQGPEDVSVIAETAGAYRIDITPLEQAQNTAAGRYEIKILELRAATEEELEARKNQLALREKGFALLAEIAQSLSEIRLPTTRVRAQLQVAQLLWASDEKRAGKLLQDAIEGVREYLTKVDVEDQNYYQTYQTSIQLRMELISALAPRDPEAALNFLRTSRILKDPNASQNRGQPNQELQLELMLANQIAVRDPKRALEIAEETLKRGYSSSLIETLARLRLTDSELAGKLARDIAAKLQTDKLLNNQEAANVAVGLLRLAGSPGKNLQEGGATGAAANVVLLSEQEYRDLFQKTLSEALSYTPPASNFYSVERSSAQNILAQLKPMTREMEGYAPGSVATVAKRSSELNAPPGPDGRFWQKYQEAINSGTVDAGLEAVSHAPQEMREQLYQNVAMKASSLGDFATARQILKDHISNPFQRQQALRNVEQQAIYGAVAKGNIEEALASLNNVRNPKERAMLLVQIVNQIGAGQKKETGLELLQQARIMIGPSLQAQDQEQMNVLLEIGRAFLPYDASRGFEVVEPLVDQFNEMSAAAMVLNGFGQQYYQDGELLMQNGNSVGNIANQLTMTLGSFAAANFDRAKASSDRIQRPEVRLGAYLAIAQRAIRQDRTQFRTVFRRN